MGDLGVVLTDSLYDYALVAANSAAVASRGGFSRCWPVLLRDRRPWAPEPLRARYDVAAVRLADLLPGDDPAQRSRELLQGVAGNGRSCILAGAKASVPDLLAALVRSLSEGRPLHLTAASPPEADRPAEVFGPAADLEAGAGQPLCVARQGSPLALAAAFYAAVTSKRFLQVADLDGLEAALRRHPPSSLILVDDLETFAKPFLERLLAWSVDSVVPFGIMTGRSAGQLSSIVCRLLLHTELRRRGERLGAPRGLEPLAAADMAPLEYCIIGAHGNEMHLRHRRGEVLCGAARERQVSAGDFDCEARCRFEGRVRADTIAAHVVFLVSCDAFTLGDGLVAPEYNVMLSFLDGWTAAVMAPYKHVLVTKAGLMLAEALVADGFSMGEVALRLNALCRYGTPPDPGYLVLGDPDLVVCPQSRRPQPPCAWTRDSEGIEVAAPAPSGRVVELALPEAAVAEVLGRDGLPAVVPLSPGLLGPDVYFALWRRPAQGAAALTLFGQEELAGEPLRLRLGRYPGLEERERHAAREQLLRLSFLGATGLGPDVIEAAREEILSLVRAVAGYPRAVELMLGDGLARHLAAALEARGESIRRRLLEAIREAMAKTSFWISQHYVGAYSHLERTSAGSDGPCPFCGNSTVRWAYRDEVTDLPGRHLTICGRCGIDADTPAEPAIELRLTRRKALLAPRERQELALRNLTSRPVRLAWLLHFNQWQDLGLVVEPMIQELTLGPGEERVRSVEVRSPVGLPDDTLHMQLFVLTEELDLYFASQKVLSMVRVAGGQPAPS